jgi:hypothetical protein
MASDKEHIQSSAEQCVPAKRKGRDDLPPRSGWRSQLVTHAACKNRHERFFILSTTRNAGRLTSKIRGRRHLPENSPQTEKGNLLRESRELGRIFLESKKLICMPDNSIEREWPRENSRKFPNFPSASTFTRSAPFIILRRPNGRLH